MLGKTQLDPTPLQHARFAELDTFWNFVQKLASFEISRVCFKTYNNFIIWKSSAIWLTKSSSSSFILKTSIFPRSARVRRSSRNVAPPHIPEHRPFLMQTKRLHIILHTFIPSLPPSCTSHPCHHHISTGRNPIILTITFHMPEPPHSTSASPPHRRSVHPEPEDCTNPHCVSLWTQPCKYFHLCGMMPPWPSEIYNIIYIV